MCPRLGEEGPPRAPAPVAALPDVTLRPTYSGAWGRCALTSWCRGTSNHQSRGLEDLGPVGIWEGGGAGAIDFGDLPNTKPAR